MTPASSATLRTSPFGFVPSMIALRVSCDRATSASAVARRGVTGCSVRSTIRGRRIRSACMPRRRSARVLSAALPLPLPLPAVPPTVPVLIAMEPSPPFSICIVLVRSRRWAALAEPDEAVRQFLPTDLLLGPFVYEPGRRAAGHQQRVGLVRSDHERVLAGPFEYL